MTLIDRETEMTQSSLTDESDSVLRLTAVDDIPALVRRIAATIQQATIGLSTAKADAILDANELLAVAALHAHSVAVDALRGQERASESSQVDPLTGLPTRLLFRDRCAQALANGKRHSTRVAVLFVDLDGFKAINDQHGHAIGDELLRHVSDCLKAAGREVDTVYRHGGDEFVILLSDATDPTAATRYAEKALAALDIPLRIGENILRIGASVGIALFPEDGHSPETLIRRADAAMYDAKRRQSRISYASAAPGSTAEKSPASVGAVSDPVRLLERSLQEAQTLVADLKARNAGLRSEVDASVHALRSAEAAKRHQAELQHIVAHELRNAMAPLQSASDVLSLMHDDPSLMPRLELILRRQISHISRLLVDILDVSRLNNGRLASTFERVDLASVMSDAGVVMAEELHGRGQTIQFSIVQSPLVVNGDRSRLRDVIVALCEYVSAQMADGATLVASAFHHEEHAVLSFDYDDRRAVAAPDRDTVPANADTTIMIGAQGSFTFSLFVVTEFVKLHDGQLILKRSRESSVARIEVCLPLLQ